MKLLKFIQALFLAFICLSSFATNRQNGKSDDISVSVVDLKNIGKGGPLRAPSDNDVVIELIYRTELSSFFISWSGLSGMVGVLIENVSTGEDISTRLDASIPMHVVPISGSSGYYTITFTTSDGHQYVGNLTL